MSLIREAEAMADAGDYTSRLPAPTMIRAHDPDEAVAIVNPMNHTWSVWYPGAPGWATLPLADGAQAIDTVQNARSIGTFSIYRVAQLRGTTGDVRTVVYPLVRGFHGERISSRVAIVLARMNALNVLEAARARLIAVSEAPAAEAPIFIELTPIEKRLVAESPYGNVLRDGVQVTG